MVSGSDRPLVSFCLPTYGRAAFIARTLRSVLAQTVTDFEVLVVDDCSPDDTAAVVASIPDPRLRYHRNERNLGVPRNLDYAMRLGKGEFTILLEDHDLLEPTYLEQTIAVMRRHPSVGFVATDIVTIDDDDRPVSHFRNAFPECMAGRTLLRRLLTRHDCPFSVTAVVRSSCLQDVEPIFDSRYGWYADQYLWLRLAAKADFGYVRLPLLKFRLRETTHVLATQEWESLLMIDRIRRENLGLLHPHAGVARVLDRLRFDVAKARVAAKLRMRRRLDGPQWSDLDDHHLRRYVPRWLRTATHISDLLPTTLIARVRRRQRQKYRADAVSA